MVDRFCDKADNGLKEIVLVCKDEPGVFLPDERGNKELPAGAKVDPLAQDLGLLGALGGRGGAWWWSATRK